MSTEDEFSNFYVRADEYSATWERRYLWTERVQLLALVAASVAATIDDASPVVVIVAFAVGVCAQLFRLVTRSDEKWWNGRAGAESAKTLCWKYVVGGGPFGMDASQPDVNFAETMREIATKVARLTPIASGDSQITAGMRTTRRLNLKDRVALYRNERVRGQLDWYATKSAWNDQRATVWAVTALLAQSGGLVIGIIAAYNDARFDYVGIFSAAGAAGVAWLAVKQHGVLARSYALASSELGVIQARIDAHGRWTEAAWSGFVSDSEEAISREHTSWRASRGVAEA